MRERVCLIVILLVASSICDAAPPQSVPYRFQNVTFIAGGFITGFVAHPAKPGLYYVRTDIGGAYRWDRAIKRWTPLQDWLPFSERNLLGAESLAVDPTHANKLYIAAGTYVNDRTPNGAILRSSDQGRHFTIARVPFKIGGNEEGRFAGERLQVDPNHPRTLLMGTRLAGLWRSDDSGENWARVDAFPAPANRIGLTFVAFDKSSGRAGLPTPVVYVGVDDPVNNLMRSEDGGKSWSAVPGSPQGLFPNHAVFSRDRIMYLSYTDRPGPNGVGNGAVWAFSPATNAWKDITPERPGAGGEQRDHAIDANAKQDAQGFGYGVVVVDPRHPQTLLASTIDRWHPGDTIFRSTDGGAHWQSLKERASRDASLAPYLKHVAPQPPFGHWIGAAMIDPFDSAHVLYGTGETIWESRDANHAVTHWTVGARGLDETADIMLLSPALPNEEGPHLFAGLGDIGCFRNDDFEHSPVDGAMKNPEMSNCDALALAAQKPEEMVRVGRSWTKGVQHGALSHDGGLHWTPFATEPEHGDQGGDAAISADGKLLLWSVRGGSLAMSNDGGRSWQTLSLQPLGRSGFQVLPDATKPQAFWAYDPGSGLLYSVDSDGAASVVSRTAPKGGKLRIPATAPEVLWVGNSTGLWRSSNGGFQFEQLPSVVAAYAVGFGKAAPHSSTPAIYLAGAIVDTPEAAPPAAGQSRGGGIYRSLDDGVTWQRIDDPQHRYAWIEQITGDPRIYGRVYLGTNGRGVVWGDAAK